MSLFVAILSFGAVLCVWALLRLIAGEKAARVHRLDAELSAARPSDAHSAAAQPPARRAA